MLGNKKAYRKALDLLFLALLVLYPLRHAGTGVDLWDGGYNYANFRYPGTDHMDSMWYFATWISTEAGALLMRLPYAGTMLGMNRYTGLIVSLLAASGFLFCVKCLKLPAWLAFLGETAACGLCWLPTSVLYNYLTFLLLTFGVILLYQGLVQERDGYLAAAGAVLGINVGVRFSNLVQTGLILAVWAYCVFAKKNLRETGRKTLLCVAGYAAALGCFLLLMGVRYGWGSYFGGIARLFAMSEAAEEYAPSGMLAAVFKAYSAPDIRYWIKRFGLALAAGTGVCLAAPGKGARVKKIFCVCVAAVLYCWLLTHLFYYPDFAAYPSIYAPCVLLLLLAAAVSAVFLARRASTAQERLLAVLELLIILLTPLGGNNAVYYNINNMFLILPFLAAMLWKLWTEKENLRLFCLKTVASVQALLVCVLALRFGAAFVYEEAAGGREMDCVITEIPVLRGMKTGAEKAAGLQGLYEALGERGLRGRRCILYGEIPGISYYMELEPALNIWADLRSYHSDVMRADLERLRGELENGGEAPVVILEAGWADYMEHQTGGGESGAAAVRKMEMLARFMEDFGYSRVYGNKKYVLYEKNTEKR